MDAAERAEEARPPDNQDASQLRSGDADADGTVEVDPVPTDEAPLEPSSREVTPVLGDMSHPRPSATEPANGPEPATLTSGATATAGRSKSPGLRARAKRAARAASEGVTGPPVAADPLAADVPDKPDNPENSANPGNPANSGTRGHDPADDPGNEPARDDASMRPSSAPRKRSSRAAPPAASPPSGTGTPPSGTAAPDTPSEPLPPLNATLAAVERLRTQVATLNLALEVEGVEAARTEREALLRQLDDYVLPRLRRRDAPLLAVIGGSTGAGKSTLTNSLVRREVSRSGVLRPTTRSPVLVHHPFDSGAFLTQRILPGLTRVTSEGPEPLQPIDPHAPRVTGLRLVPHEGLTPGLGLIDAPDIDSLVDTNRDLAVQLLAAADLWIFVTTAVRYADAMPWQMLQQAIDRGVTVAIVLDRVPPPSIQELRIHLATKLRDRGLANVPMFVIPETMLDAGLLPAEVVAPLLQWLRRVAGDSRSRTVIANRTLSGIIGSIPARTRTLADAADAQQDVDVALRASLEESFNKALVELLRRLGDGSLVRGELLARWQDFMAAGGLLRRLDKHQPSFGERLVASFRRHRPAPVSLSEPMVDAVAATLRDAAQGAVDTVATRWRELPGGAGLVDRHGRVLAAQHVGEEPEQAAAAWRDRVFEHVRTVLEQARADGLSNPPDIETVADALMVDAVTPPATAPDGEPIATPAATAAVGRRILGAVIGEEPVRAIAEEARADLASRATEVLDAERGRLQKVLDAGGALNRRGAALRVAAETLEEAL